LPGQIGLKLFALRGQIFNHRIEQIGHLKINAMTKQIHTVAHGRDLVGGNCFFDRLNRIQGQRVLSSQSAMKSSTLSR
jgi:hypothetical protein